MGAAASADWGAEACELYYATMNNDMERARELQRKGRVLRDVVDAPSHNIYCSFKAAMNARGLPGGYPRLPLRALAGSELDALRRGLESQGLGPVATGRTAVAE